MKKISLITMASLMSVALLTSCADSNQTKAAQIVSKSCPNLLKNDANIIDIREAARLDSKWVPLVEAAIFYRLNHDTAEALTNSALSLELKKSVAVILTFCTDSTGK